MLYPEFKDHFELDNDSKADELANFLFEKEMTIDIPEGQGAEARRVIEPALPMQEIEQSGHKNFEALSKEVEEIMGQDYADENSGLTAIDTVQKHQFIVKGLVKTIQGKVEYQVDGTTETKYEDKYLIWECEHSNRGQQFLLFSRPQDNIRTGTIECCTSNLKATELSNYKVPNLTDPQIEAMLGVTNSDQMGESGWEAFKTKVAQGQIEVRRPVEAVKESSKRMVANTLDMQKAVDLAIEGDHDLDEKIRYIFRGMLPQLNDGVLSPKEVMQYQPHSLLVTNTKVGKSTTARNIGRVVEEASSAGLMGFSGAEDSYKGALDDERGMIAFDEIDKSDNKVFSKITSFMAQGRVEIMKGGDNVITQGSPNLMAFANPYTGDTSEDEHEEYEGDDIQLANSFDQVINTISSGTSFKPLGRRFGVVLFSNDLETATQNDQKSNQYTKDELDKNRSVVESMMAQCQPDIRRLISTHKVETWISTSMDEFRKEVYDNLQSNGALPTQVKDFWKGHAEANKRIRGFALKQAIMDNIEFIWTNDDYKPWELADRVLEDAEHHVSRAKALSLESLNNINSMATTNEDIIRNRFEGLSKWKKSLVTGLSYAAMKNPHWIDSGEWIEEKEVSSIYNNMDDYEGIHDKWWKIKNGTRSNTVELDQELSRVAGVRLKEVDGDMHFLFPIQDIETIAKHLHTDKDIGHMSDKSSESDLVEGISRKVHSFIESEGPLQTSDIEDKFGSDGVDALEKLNNDGRVMGIGPDKWKVE